MINPDKLFDFLTAAHGYNKEAYDKSGNHPTWEKDPYWLGRMAMCSTLLGWVEAGIFEGDEGDESLPKCGGFVSMQRLWTQTGTETVEERWVPRQCQRCNPVPEHSEEVKEMIAMAREENRRRDIEEMKQLLSGLRGRNG